MLVLHVQRVPGELGATTSVAANHIRILVACSESATEVLATIPKGHTGDRPDQVVGDVCAFGGHGDGVLDSMNCEDRNRDVCVECPDWGLAKPAALGIAPHAWPVRCRRSADDEAVFDATG